MYKATRDLINARQPHAACRMDVVNVKNVGGGKIKNSHNDAFSMALSDSAISVVSGWLVLPIGKCKMSAEIVSHYWNCKDGEYFDTTPGVTSDYEYVTDMDLHAYAVEHCEKQDDYVSMSLCYKKGKFILVDGIGGVAYPFGEVLELTTEALFDRGSRRYRACYALHMLHAA